MNGLRVRLLLVTVLVATVAVLVSALFSRQVVTSEFRRFTGVQPVDLGAVTRELESLARSPEPPAGFEAVLVRHARRLGRALVLADSSGAVLAASVPQLRAAHLAFGPDGRVTFGRPGDPASPGALLLELHRPPKATIRDPSGRVLGTLFALPEAGPPDVRRGDFVSGVQRGVWLGALVAIAIGALLVGLLSSRLLGPIEALTAAAGRMQRGDLAARVPAAGADEVSTLARAFNAMAESLDRALALRRQLTHDVAHELRTPLTNLRAQIEALEDGLLTPDPATLGSLKEEVLLLAGLVADLEQLAAAEAGELRLDLTSVDVREALASAAAAFAPRAEAQGIALVTEAAPGLQVRADDLRLAQMLRNLIANALAHTPAGGRITLSATRAAAGIEIAVADTGAGIPPEHLPHVFDRFYRADPSRSRATGGAGLGLAIVRSLVRAQAGEVRAGSEPGRGTRIAFTLPAA